MGILANQHWVKLKKYHPQIYKAERMQQMTNNIEKDLKKYYKDISKTLPRGRKKEIIRTIKSSVDSYLAENPNAKIDEVINYFGEPNDIAQSYYDNEKAEDISSKIKLSHKILICIVTVLALALLIYIVFVVKALIHSIQTESAYSITTITETSQSDI